MKSSTAKKASITLPEGLEKALRRVAQKEHRTLSGVLQEAARYYLAVRRFETLQQELVLQGSRLGLRSEQDVDELVHGLRHRSQ